MPQTEEPNFYMLPYVLKALYASEINCGLSSFFDGGYTVWIGDDMNGRRAEGHVEPDCIWLAADWLTQAACHLYPSSGFARLASGSLGDVMVFDPKECLPTVAKGILSLIPAGDS